MEMEPDDIRDWSLLWAWIDGRWRRVRITDATYTSYIVEPYTEPGKLYEVPLEHCIRPDEPRPPHPNLSK